MATYHTETSNRISDSLWRLMERFMFEDISITMICQRARVGRRSFYRHFKTKRDVLTNTLKQQLDELSTHLAESGSMEEMMGRSFKFFYKERKYLRLLQKNGLLFEELYSIIQAGRLFDEELDVFMERSGLPPYLREYAANVIASVHTSLLVTWTASDFREDWQQLVNFEISMFSAMQ